MGRRLTLQLAVMTQIGVYLLYFGIAGFSYYFLCPSAALVC